MGHAGAHDRRSDRAPRSAPAPSARQAADSRSRCEARRSCGCGATAADVFSHGFICPKGSTLKQLHEDPDRLRRPLVKRDGEFVEVSWEEAFAEIERRLVPIIDAHGRDAVATYIGNPTAHNLSAMLYARTLAQGIGTRMRFSAGTVDQVPKQVAAGYMFGTAVTVPVPDIDRSDYMMILGANPYASNGSLCTAPDFPGRLEALRARGGRSWSSTPEGPRPRKKPTSGSRSCPAPTRTSSWRSCTRCSTKGSPTRAITSGRGSMAGRSSSRWLPGSRPSASRTRAAWRRPTIRRLARELAGAPTAAVYGRIGICTAGLRHARLVARRCRQRRDREPRSSRRRHVQPARRGRRGDSGRAGQGEGLSNGTRAHACARARGGARGVSRRGAGRGDRDRGSRSGAGARHRGGQPGAVDAQQRAAGRSPRAARVHGEHRHLPQ